MKPIGNEGLDLFCGRTPGEVLLAQGQRLRDAALARSREGRQDQIAKVRDWLITRHHIDPVERMVVTPHSPTLTADDVHDAVDALGLGDGDTRWTANILRGWKINGVPVVAPTAQFVASRRPSRSAAPTRVWKWV